MKIYSFEDLTVWQRGHRLVLDTYEDTKTFPKTEIFCLVSQMRRCAISITSNIAEGFGRRSTPDKRHFYVMAAGSNLELRNQYRIARDLGYISEAHLKECNETSEEMAKMLNRLISTFRIRD